MPRPTDKTSLLALGESNYNKLMALVDDFTEDELAKSFPKPFMNRNIRDVLAHLHVWHEMMLTWHKLGMAGDKPEIPAIGYTWKTTPDLNRIIWEDVQSWSLNDTRSRLDDSYTQVRETIESHSNNELFTKKKYKWTGSTSMGAYVVSATSSHYDWAIKLIKKCRKNLV